jgi:serine kinase of HPr protein (carbohydrate metabolism regulator)
MTTEATPSIHASAVAVGTQAILIRGPSGSGKSRLAFDLILAGRAGQIPQTVLIGDDRVRLSSRDGMVVVRPVANLAGLIEIRGLGVRHCDFINEATVAMVVDLAADDAERLPPPHCLRTSLLGKELPRISVGKGFPAVSMVLAALLTSPDPASEAIANTLGLHGRSSTFA